MRARLPWSVRLRPRLEAWGCLCFGRLTHAQDAVVESGAGRRRRAGGSSGRMGPSHLASGGFTRRRATRPQPAPKYIHTVTPRLLLHSAYVDHQSMADVIFALRSEAEAALDPCVCAGRLVFAPLCFPFWDVRFSGSACVVPTAIGRSVRCAAKPWLEPRRSGVARSRGQTQTAGYVAPFPRSLDRTS